jgi:hypothetical protein
MNKHLNQAKENERFLEVIQQHFPNDFFDWKITFYSTSLNILSRFTFLIIFNHQVLSEMGKIPNNIPSLAQKLGFFC